MDRDHHLPARLAKPGVVPEALMAVGHGEDAVNMLEGAGELRSAVIGMLEGRDVDELEVRSVGSAVPDAFPELDPSSARGGEARIGDVLEYPVAVGAVIIAP